MTNDKQILRARLLLLVLLAGFAVLAGRLVDLQFVLAGAAPG